MFDIKIVLLVCLLINTVLAADDRLPGFAGTTAGADGGAADLKPFKSAADLTGGKLEVQWGSDFDGGFVNGEVYWQQARNRKGTTTTITTTTN